MIVEKLQNGSKIVEVGSWLGQSSSYMGVEIYNSNKNISFNCVDTWNGSNEHQEQLSGKSQDYLYNKFLRNIHPIRNIITPIRLSSVDASKKFKNNSLDFVFIDADHSYESVKTDIISWLPKLKSDGIISGHDYYDNDSDGWPGIKKAVDEILKDVNFYSGSVWCKYLKITKG